jgi:hypothetical protein
MIGKTGPERRGRKDGVRKDGPFAERKRTLASSSRISSASLRYDERRTLKHVNRLAAEGEQHAVPNAPLAMKQLPDPLAVDLGSVRCRLPEIYPIAGLRVSPHHASNVVGVVDSGVLGSAA